MEVNMFASIRLQSVLPDFLTVSEAAASEIWNRDVIFSKGERHLISAASGEGKSSLLAFMFGERMDYAGNIFYDDREIRSLDRNDWSEVRQYGISSVFQDLRLFDGLTAFENISLKNRLTRCKSDGEIARMMEQAGIADKRDEKTARLSFGQQQRVAIIRALCQPFDILLMDEPFSHLDDANIDGMAELVSGELNARDAGLVLCSLGSEYPFDYHRKWKL